jgi:hypothetical protein
MARKKPIISPLGQWAYPGEVTIIPSSDITMKGVNYPVLGIDDLGNQQMMMPGQDYTFPGNYVTEIPQMGKGGLRQWFDEKWVDVKTGKACGRSGKDKDGRPYPACRPSKRVNETTPKTTSEMSSSEKAKFKREKTSGKRIDYNHKRREDGGETGWLDQYQTGGWAGWTPNVGKPYMRTSPAGNAGYTDNTRVVNQNTNVTPANRKAAEAASHTKDNGFINSVEATLNPYNWGVPDYTKSGTRAQAFSAARKAGQKEFMWNNKRYNTRKDTDPIEYIGDHPNQEEYDEVLRTQYPEFFKMLNRGQNVGNISFEGYESSDGGFNRAFIEKNPSLLFSGNSKIAVGQNPYSSQEFISNLIAEAGHLKDNNLDESIFNPHTWKAALDNFKFGENQYNIPGTAEYNAHRLIEPGVAMVAYGNLSPDDIKRIQKNLGVKEDGYFGEKTYKALQNKYKDNDYIQRGIELHQFYTDKDENPIEMGTFPELAKRYLHELNKEVPLKYYDRFSEDTRRSDYTDAALLSTSGDNMNTLLLQHALKERGYALPKSTINKPSNYNWSDSRYYKLDGKYGEETKNALLDWQNKNITKKQYGGWLDQFQTGGAPSDIERMQGAEIFKKRSWLDKLRGYVHKGEKAIGLDPYNERSDDFMEQWARRINTATGGKDWYKQPNDASGAGGIGTAMMETVMAPFSAPQLASVYGATGKVQMPSEAMNIQNPVGSFLADAILDPTNLVGAGIAKNLGKGSLQNMLRNRSRGVRPDFTPNVSNQLAPPPSEIIVDPTTGQFNSYFNQDMERPYFDQWVRMMDNNASELDVSNLFANPAESIDLRKLKKSKNRSGLTKEDVLKNASPKDKEALSKMSESEFEQTVLKPTGEVVSYEPAINLGLGFNTNTKNLNLSNTIPMDNSEYVDIFNSRLDRLNEIISRNNKSGLDYSVKGLSPSGALTFNNPAQIEKLPVSDKVINELKKRGLIDSEGNMSSSAQEYVDRWTNRNIPQGESTWMLDINPGQWRGEVEDIANSEYFKAIPGLNMRNTTASVFSDALPREGTRTYQSINEYLKELDLGRVKPGFNSQSEKAQGVWESAIKKGNAFGFFSDPTTLHGSMRTITPLVAGAAAASQLPEQKNGGWLDIYQDGGENLPELNSKIDIANFYKNPLSEKYGIYQDPEDDTYKYYLKSGDESSILQSGPDLSNINSRRLAEINSQKGSLSNAQLANIKNVSPVILPEQKQRILRDKVYYDQEDLMEQAMSESPIPSVKTPSYSEILESDPEFKRVMTEKPKPVAPIKPKPVAANTPLVPIGNAPRAIVKPAVRKVVAKNDIVNLADLTITKADKAYLNKVDEYCPGGNCLETTRNAYDMLAGRIQGIPTSSDIWSNDLKVHSKKGKPTANDIKQFPYFAGDSGSGTLDSWDAQGRIVETGGKNFYNINTPTPINYKEIPVGALIGWGPKNQKNSNYESRNQGYNIKFGMQPSHHSTMVVGYSEDGEPIVYDGFLEKYMTLTEAKANIGSRLGYELENISAPKSVLNNTQDNLKNQGVLLNYIPPTNINPNKILAAANQPWAQIPEGSVKRAPRFNKQMMTEFNSALINNKGELMRNLNISSEKYDEFSKILLAIQAQESEGGGGLGSVDWKTVGMTQLNPDNIYDNEKLAKIASKPYMLNDGNNNILSPSLIQKSPSASAVASMIYISQLEKDAKAKYAEGKKPQERKFEKNSNIAIDLVRSNTSRYNSDGFFVEEANKRIDLSPFEGGILSSADPVAAQKLLNKTAGNNKYRAEVNADGDLVIIHKTKGNADLTLPEIIGYGWQSLNTLKYGDAQGDSVHNKRIKNYYDLLNNTTPTYRKEGGQTGWLNKYK